MSSHPHNGYVMLMTVLIIGAVGVTLVAATIVMGLTNGQTALLTEQAATARAYAQACAENSLQLMRTTTTYTGTAALTLTDGTCTATVTNTGGNNRALNASGTVGSITKKISIATSAFDPVINITSWKEVSDF